VFKLARQKLSEKNHNKCEAITGRKYDRCLVRGGQPHFVAKCVHADDFSKYDLVNYKTGKHCLDIDLNETSYEEYKKAMEKVTKHS
jgi:hypothetical protein